MVVVMAAVVMVLISVVEFRSVALNTVPLQFFGNMSHLAMLTPVTGGTGRITDPPIPTQNVKTALAISPHSAP